MAISSSSTSLRTVASVFGLREQMGMPLHELLLDYLRDKEWLLVVDNCEHLVESCAQLIEQLLHACAKLKIIASSREALGIAGETVYRVPSLTLPEGSDQDPASLAASESVQLFVERASAANPNFNLNETNASAIAQICRRLDGIPLALELAAARLTVFSAEQVAARLDDRFRLLTGGSRTALPRQQTLRALIDWSYDLLTEPERSLFRRFSVFAGGCTYEAIEKVCHQLEVLDLLSQLVNKSLVAVEDGDREPRYRLLETVRQYARDKLLEMGEALGDLLREGGQADEALPFLERAARLRPEDVAAKFSLGALYVALGRTEEALPLLEQVAKVAPEHLQTQMQLAVVYHRLGRTEDSARARAAVGRIQSEGENRFFKGVSDALSRLLGKTTAP